MVSPNIRLTKGGSGVEIDGVEAERVVLSGGTYYRIDKEGKGYYVKSVKGIYLKHGFDERLDVNYWRVKNNRENDEEKLL